MTTAQATAALIVLGSVMLSGCGTALKDSPSRQGGDEPVTARAIAFIASEHFPEPPVEAHSGTDFDNLDSRSVGTELEFNSIGGRVGPRLTVAVVGTDSADKLTNCSDDSETCMQTRGVTLRWQPFIPEEDPGGVSVYATKGDTVVAMFQAGESILGDPRTQDLQISVKTMIDIATDPRLDATTSASAVDAGEHLTFWKGKDSSPAGPRVSEPSAPRSP